MHEVAERNRRGHLEILKQGACKELWRGHGYGETDMKSNECRKLKKFYDRHMGEGSLNFETG